MIFIVPYAEIFSHSTNYRHQAAKVVITVSHVVRIDLEAAVSVPSNLVIVHNISRKDRKLQQQIKYTNTAH